MAGDHLRVETLPGSGGENPYTPLVIGATGGSGTRAVRELMHRAGLFMGVRLNDSGDAMDLVPFLDGYVNRLLRAGGGVIFRLDQLPRKLRAEALAEFRAGLDRYRTDLPPAARWGWKNPRSVFILPIIHHFFPDMQYIHVVRDGRDMALSANQNPLKQHYEALFGHRPSIDIDPAESARLWAVVNGQVADWGESTLGKRYLRIRFEDLCESPVDTVMTLVESFDLPSKDAEAATRGIKRPPSIGRWRQAGPETVARITAVAGAALRRFGYL